MTERKSLESERAELEALADAVEAQANGFDCGSEPRSVLMRAASALRAAAVQGEPFGWLIDRKIEPVFFTKSRTAADEYASQGATTMPVYTAQPPAAGWGEAIEAAKLVVERWSLPTIQTPSLWLIDKAGIVAEIEALRHNAPPDSGAGKSEPAGNGSLPSGENDHVATHDCAGSGEEMIIARAICRSDNDAPSCVMDSHPEREPCNDTNCRRFEQARAVMDALAKFSPLPDHGGADAGGGVRVRELEAENSRLKAQLIAKGQQSSDGWD